MSFLGNGRAKSAAHPMNRYIDESLLPTADAIGKMPSFGGADARQNDTQLHPQTLDISGNEQSLDDIAVPEPEPSKVVYPEEFWHKKARPDIAVQNCLARIRT
jgi:hypothetical protein